MENARYTINKYYTLEEINVAVGEPAVQALVEKFMVIKVEKRIRIVGDPYIYEEIKGDGFNSYKDALDYIEIISELPKAR